MLRKNLAPCAGRPLLHWSILLANYMGADTVVSTDDEEIAEIAYDYGAAVRLTTDEYLHSDECKSLDVWRDAWDRETYFKSILLEPTCPTRQVEDVERCLAMLDRCTSAVTVSEATPCEKLFKLESGRISGTRSIRRQDCEPVYKANGACYAMRADHEGEILENAGAVIIDKPRISIDNLIDLWISEMVIEGAEALMQHPLYDQARKTTGRS